MPCGTFTHNKLTKAQADTTEALYSANKPPPVVTVTQAGTAPDGSLGYTLVAKFPPCPANVTFSKKGAVPS